MIDPAIPPDVGRFRAAVQRTLGLCFEDAKMGFLAEVLHRRLEKSKLSDDDYLRNLEAGTAPDEIGPLAQELTVTETYFYRNIDQFHAFREAVLPQRIRVRGSSKSLRFLSAACSSGEEAYTIAIIAAETIADPSWNVSIRAVDINPAVLAKARRAHYATWALRETPADTVRKWFHVHDRALILDEAVREAVNFETKNITMDDPDLWRPGFYDAIFCRNVIMYFAPEQANRTVERIARALAPGGYLFLGHAETLRGLSDAFHLRHTHETFYYQRKDEADDDRKNSYRTEPQRAPATAALSLGAPALALTDSWVDAIRLSTERIEALARSPNPAPTPVLKSSSLASSPVWDLARVFDLIRTERYIEALARVRQLPSDADGDADVLLVKAMLLAHAGEYVAAASACRRLLQIEELNAGAHYVLALSCEGLGDLAAAEENDRVAIYLDAAFAMPRLHVGLLARRAGNAEMAQREIARALLLLKHEDASRLLLFGGGFSRQALIGLCESVLRDVGEPP